MKSKRDAFRLDGKVALITGGGSGLGQTTAVMFAKRGAKLGLLGRDNNALENTRQMIESEGGLCQTFVSDVTNVESLRIAVDGMLKRFKKIDILANVAGIWNMIPFLQLSEAQLDEMLNINFKGCFNAIQLVLPHMVTSKYGRVVSVSSSAAKEGSAFGCGHYAASKSAIFGLNASLAKEFGSYGITFNAVCPGPMLTPMGEQIKEVVGAANYKANVARNALKRPAQPEEVASVIAFLASDAASFVTGQSWNVCGGMLFD